MLTPIGTKCKIITEPYNYKNDFDDSHSGHEFPIGTIVRIAHRYNDVSDEVEMKAEYLDGSDYWYINENDI